MGRLNSASDPEYLFVALMIAANKMDTLLERSLKKHQITAKQWLLLLVVINLSECPPTVGEAAREMGSSHQNVMQMALKLEQKGMLRLEKDGRDRRVIRLVATEKSLAFWKAAEEDGIAFLNAFYNGIGRERMAEARASMADILSNLSRMEEA